MSAPDPHAVPRTLPRGRHDLDRDTVLASQRARLLDAIAELTAEKGYAAVTIADVTGRAGTAKRTFYVHFADKQSCFLAAFDAAIERLIGVVGDALTVDVHPSERVRQGVGALLGLFADNPTFAQVYLVDVHAAGPRALARRAQLHRMIAAMLVAQREQVRTRWEGYAALDERHALAIVGAVHELLLDFLGEHGATRLRELGDELTAIVIGLMTATVALPPRDAERDTGR